MASVSHRSAVSTFSISPPAASGMVNVKDTQFGAKGDGVTDDRVAIYAAIAYAQANNFMGVYFPTGTYIISRSSLAGSTAFGSLAGIDIYQMSNLTFQGCGPGTILKMSTLGSGDYYLLRMRHSDHITIRDMTLDGNFPLGSDETGITEQLHCVGMVGNTGDTTPLTDVFFHNVTFQNTRGDGIKLGGVTRGITRRVVVSNCKFTGCARAGIVLQANIQDILIDANTFHNQKRGDIDAEPSGTGSDSEWTITNNKFYREYNPGVISCSLSGSSTANPARQNIFANNTIVDGIVEGGDTGRLLVSGNRFYGPNMTDTEATIRFHGRVDDLQIVNNYVYRGGEAAACILVDYLSTQYPKGVLIQGNICHQATESNIIICDQPSDITIANNICYFEGTSTNTQIGIRWNCPTATITNGTITGNQIIGNLGGGTLKYGIQLGGSFTTNGAIISDNRVVGSVTGIKLEAQSVTFTVPPIVSNNDVRGSSAGVTFTGGYIAIAGNLSTSGRTIFRIASGSPESVITAGIGSLCFRDDGGAGTSLYVKESGTGNTGWVGK